MYADDLKACPDGAFLDWHSQSPSWACDKPIGTGDGCMTN